MPTFDPRALLNPKGQAKQSREAREKEEAQKRAEFRDQVAMRDGGTFDIPNAKPQSIGMGTFIEQQHRPEERSNQKRIKRPKPDNNDDGGGSDTEVRNNKIQKGGSVRGASGVWASQQDAMKKKYQQNGPQAVIDLTNDAADNEDFAANAKERQKEVCLGSIQDAFINVHRVPTPKSTGFQGTDKMWQPMKVELRRRLAGAHNTAISAFDPQGRNFGTVDPRIAQVLAPLMDASASNKVRVSARLNVRKRKPYDLPGKETSEKLEATITIYSPLNQVKGIGQRFGQANIWLRHPNASERGIEIVNPHEPTNYGPKAIKAAPSYKRPNAGEQRMVQRTAEEIREDVCHIFDSLKDSTKLPEMEPCDLIKTPLLSHQKQALYFLTQRETDNRQPKPLGTSQYDKDENANSDIIDITEEEDELSLWIERRRRNGNIEWYHAITGHVINQKPTPVLGGILADVMGLGKTLNMLSLICGTLDEARKFGHEDPPVEDVSMIKVNSKATLIVAPLSTVSNWEDQLRAHIKKGSLRVTVHHGMKRTNNPEDLCHYDVVITTYSVVSADAERRSRARPNNPLGEVNWFRIVLDEAHSIREQATRQSKAVCALTAQRRWAVTGTPIQNRLDDLGALIKFLHIQPFDEPGNFAQFIIAPFKVADVEILPKLRVLVDSITLRRGKDKVNLPTREEQIKWLRMTDAEASLYRFFEKDSHAKMRAVLKDKVRGRNTVANVLHTILRLRMLCAHGAEMLSDEDLDASRGITMNTAIDLEEETEKSDMSPREAYRTFRMLRDAQANDCCLCGKWVQPPNDNDTESSSASSSDSSDADNESEDGRPDTEYRPAEHGPTEFTPSEQLKGTEGVVEKKGLFGHMTSCNHLLCPDCLGEFREKQWAEAYSDGYANCIDCGFYIRISFFELRTKELIDDERSTAEIKRNPKLARANGTYNGPHTKTRWLVESLQTDRAVWLSQDTKSRGPPIKATIFSGWTTHLDLIQIALTEANITFTRLDGSMTRSARTQALHNFENNYDIQCILVSIGAGGLGLNLTAASRVYLMEPQFNPAAEDQAIERVHRLGQKRPVIIYKLMMKDSFEEKILELQKRKRRLAQMSLERREMGKFEERGSAKRSLEDLKALFR